MQLVVALFTSLRMFAIWDKRLLIFCFVLALGLVSPVMEVWYYTRLSFLAAPSPFMGCATFVNLTQRTGIIFAFTTASFNIAVDCAILILTWLKTGGIWRHSKNIPLKGYLSTILLRDGAIYFLALLVLNALDIVAIQSQILGALPALTQVITAVLINRFLFNLREIYPREGGLESTISTRSSDFSPLRFTSSILGNLGEPLSNYDERKALVDDIELDVPNHKESRVVSYRPGDSWAIGAFPEVDGTKVWRPDEHNYQ